MFHCTYLGGQVTEVPFSTFWRMRTKLHFSIARVIGNLQTQRPPQGVAGHAEDWERRICPIFHSFSKFEPMCHMGHAISMLCSSHDRGGQGKPGSLAASSQGEMEAKGGEPFLVPTMEILLRPAPPPLIELKPPNFQPSSRHSI